MVANSSRSLVCAALSIALLLTPPVAAQEVAAPEPKYKIEVLTAAGKVKKRKKNVISSESVIRVTDNNDVPVAGATVMFSIAQLTGGSAAFANGAVSTIVATNAAGIASTGAVSAATASSFSIAATASVAGQAVSITIPMNMAAVAAAGGAAAGAGGAAGGAAGAGGGAAAGGAAAAGATAGISAAVVGVVAAVAAGAAVAAKVVLSSDDPPKPGPSIRIGGPGTPRVGGQ